MIAKTLSTAAILALSTSIQTGTLRAEDTEPHPEPTPEKSAGDKENPPKDQTKEEIARVGEALQALAKDKDEEALKLLEKAKAEGGKLGITADQAFQLVKKAKEKGLIPAIAPKSGIEQDAALAGKVLGQLADKGDARAKELMEKAKANGGKLEMTKEDVSAILKSARESGLLPKADGATILKAIQALADKGDADAKAKLDDAKSKGGKLEITPADAEKFVEKAKSKGLLK